MHGHHRFEQARNAGGRFGVADISLDGTERGRWGVRFRLASGFGQYLQLGGITDGSPRAMAFKIGHTINAKASAAIGATHRLELALGFRPRNAAAAIGRNAPTANNGINAAALGQSVLVPHQRHKAATFTWPKPRRTAVVNAHLFRREGAGLGETH